MTPAHRTSVPDRHTRGACDARPAWDVLTAVALQALARGIAPGVAHGRPVANGGYKQLRLVGLGCDSAES